MTHEQNPPSDPSNPEDSRPEIVDQADRAALESKLRLLMLHPNRVPLAVADDEDGEVVDDELGELELPVFYETEYRKDEKTDVRLRIIEPGTPPPLDGRMGSVRVESDLYENEDNHHRFARIQDTDLYLDKLTYHDTVREFDADDRPVRTAEMEALASGDISSVIARMNAESDFGLFDEPSMTREEFNELMGLLDTLTPEDEITG